jgi:hypothetical protein
MSRPKLPERRQRIGTLFLLEVVRLWLKGRSLPGETEIQTAARLLTELQARQAETGCHDRPETAIGDRSRPSK